MTKIFTISTDSSGDITNLSIYFDKAALTQSVQEIICYNKNSTGRNTFCDDMTIKGMLEFLAERRISRKVYDRHYFEIRAS